MSSLSIPSATGTNSFHPETESAVDLVTAYYLAQVDHDWERMRLPEILAEIRQSVTCRAFAAELPAVVQWDLCPYVPLDEYEPELRTAEAAGIGLLQLAQIRAQTRLQTMTTVDDISDESRAELPVAERLRCGDWVEVIDRESPSVGCRGNFCFYTDPRVGETVRRALVQIEGGSGAPIAVLPHQLAPLSGSGARFEKRHELLRCWENDDFELRLYDTRQTDARLGKPLLAYELVDRCFGADPELIFYGEDFAASPLHALDSDATAAAVLGFLALKRGDTDEDYFEKYSAFQRRWRGERAADLAQWQQELEQGAGHELVSPAEGSTASATSVLSSSSSS